MVIIAFFLVLLFSAETKDIDGLKSELKPLLVTLFCFLTRAAFTVLEEQYGLKGKDSKS